ncbi:hypothetical protein FAVG1_09621 [Fusarium avenaceum]|nr:hypothetical protein FAVG1_09621 [Fusarium avenaceum]
MNTEAVLLLARHRLAYKVAQIAKLGRHRQSHRGIEDPEAKDQGNRNKTSSKRTMVAVLQGEGRLHVGRAVHLAKLILPGTEGRELIGHLQGSLPSVGALVGSSETYGSYQPRYNSSYDQQSSQYGGSPPPTYGSSVTSNTSRTRQSTYQQVDSYGQPYPYTQQPAVQQPSYGEDPYEQQYQGRPPYGRQTSPRQPQTYVQRYSYEQSPPGQRSDGEPEGQQYPGGQEPYGQQSPFGQTSPYAQAPPYGQQAAYSEYPPYAPYYGSSSTAQVVNPASYRTEIDSQELSARMGNVRLEDSPYRQPNTDERYEYDEDQEAVAEEVQATSSRNRAHMRRSGRR